MQENNSYSKGGKLIKRADGSYSRRGLWDIIRAIKGSGKKPTKQMLEQERKIKAKYPDGGEVAGKTGMMKARMALEAEFGNPAAKRMISPNPLIYNFTGNEPDDFWRDKPQTGESGTHYISNEGKYAIPMLQEKQNKLHRNNFD
jgi:hypothetical protein